ncbi:MAG TPA: Hsp20/alpha crystallin family protein [Chryseosolibacter sp.]|nr:Hsp20/alpha crystallin family protein [Chryseosolibacter sp.]
MKNRTDHIDLPAWIENGFEVPHIFNRGPVRPVPERGVSTPAVNIIETGDDFRLEMVAPGMKRQAFNIDLRDSTLTVTYDHPDNQTGERSDWKYRTREYNYHSFTRSFLLPDTIATEKISATYRDGILTIILPKKDDARSKLRRIKIE